MESDFITSQKRKPCSSHRRQTISSHRHRQVRRHRRQTVDLAGLIRPPSGDGGYQTCYAKQYSGLASSLPIMCDNGVSELLKSPMTLDTCSAVVVP